VDPRLNDMTLLYPSLYLKAADLQGKDLTLTIREVVVGEELKTERGADRVQIIYFEETRAKAERDGVPAKEKRLVLNKSNNLIICGLYGKDGNKWGGKRITLYAAPYKSEGRIAVRPVVPPAPAKPATEVA
jgi:hypothetical protein